MTLILPMRGTRSRRILVVEDEWLIARFVEEIIIEAGHRVIGPATNVVEALRLGQKAPIDAALVDLRLNGRWAYEAADTLLDRQIPFYFVTGCSHIPQLYAEIPTIQKPFSTEDIGTALNHMLTRLAPNVPTSMERVSSGRTANHSRGSPLH